MLKEIAAALAAHSPTADARTRELIEAAQATQNAALEIRFSNVKAELDGMGARSSSEVTAAQAAIKSLQEEVERLRCVGGGSSAAATLPRQTFASMP